MGTDGAHYDGHYFTIMSVSKPFVFVPPLDVAGDSVMGQQVAGFLSGWLGLSLFISAPVARDDDTEEDVL